MHIAAPFSSVLGFSLLAAGLGGCVSMTENQYGGANGSDRAPLGATASAALVNAQGGSSGTVTLRQGPRGLVMTVEASGLTPGWHGIHLHAVGSCDGPGFTTAEGHIHSGDSEAIHGLLNAQGNDNGDLPNIHAGTDGRAMADIFTPFARLTSRGPGDNLLDADGSALIIHAMPDDYSAQPIGGAGPRVACGVIRAG